MVGVPPAAGFISKWFMLLGALEVENLFAVGVIVLSTLLNAAYFLPIVYAGFFRTSKKEPSHSHTHDREAPLPIVMTLTTSALLTVLFFCFPDIPLTLAYQLIGATP